MLLSKPAARAALASLVASALAGCASTAIDDNVAQAQAEVHALSSVDFTWLASDAALARAADDVAATLRRPLNADDAVHLALAYSPALQAALFDRAAASARATRSARLPNPVFEFERLAGAGQLDITRALTWPLMDVLLLPARTRAATATQQRLREQLAIDVLRAAADARLAWIDAVSAQQAALYAGQVDDAAQAGAELARRLEAAGNFSRLQRVREEAFAGEATTALADARRARRATRETLVRALGLDADQAAAMTLPEHLPDLPRVLDAPAALDDRLDLRLARLRLDALAREQGLVATARVVDGLAIGAAREDQTGTPVDRGPRLSLPLPLFDTGDATRAEARATYHAALMRTAALAVAAASELREAQADARARLAVALEWRDRLVPLRATIVDENLLRYNGMLASVFDLLADAREQSRAVRQAIAAQRDFWRAEQALARARLGIPAAPAPDAGTDIDADTDTPLSSTPRRP